MGFVTGVVSFAIWVQEKIIFRIRNFEIRANELENYQLFARFSSVAKLNITIILHNN